MLKALLLSLLLLPLARAEQKSVAPGLPVPSFTLQDQDGRTQTFDSLKGPHGLLILFNRSADWCPFCKAQLIDLEAARKRFEAQGVHVAAVTYDSPAILSNFAHRKGIHFTLLSDPGSKTIDAFGIRNMQATGREVGVPVPAYYFIDPTGVVRARHVETGLSDRITASYFYASIFSGTPLPAASTTLPETPHLSVALQQSDTTVAPGSRLQLTVLVGLKPGEHLYAPGAEKNGYRPIRIELATSPLYAAGPAHYPSATLLHFDALHETVPVFEKNTAVALDVTPTRSADSVKLFASHPDLQIHGTLHYQVCTLSTCFPPAERPILWKLRVAAADLDETRVPESLREH